MRPSEALLTKRDDLRRLIGRYPVHNPRVFGSVNASSDGIGSDLDILVDPDPRTTYFDLSRLSDEAGRLLGVTVDIRTPNELPSRFRQTVLGEARPL